MRVFIDEMIWTPAPISLSASFSRSLSRHFSTFLRNPRACQEQNGAAAAASDALEESEGTKQEVIIAE